MEERLRYEITSRLRMPVILSLHESLSVPEEDSKLRIPASRHIMLRNIGSGYGSLAAERTAVPAVFMLLPPVVFLMHLN